MTRSAFQDLQYIEIGEGRRSTFNRHKGITNRCGYGGKRVTCCARNDPEFLLQIRVVVDICHETRNSWRNSRCLYRSWDSATTTNIIIFK